MRATGYERLAKSARLFGLISVFAAGFCSVAASQTRQAGLPPGATIQPAPPAAETAPRVSKFEARRIRHACRDEAAAKPGTQASPKNVMAHCFQMHVLARRVAKECKNTAEFKGQNGSAREAFMQNCLSEKMRNVAPLARKAQDQ